LTRRGSALQAVVYRFAQPVMRDRRDSDAFGGVIKLVKHGEEVSRRFVQIATG
jgi:hypothetical protein